MKTLTALVVSAVALTTLVVASISDYAIKKYDVRIPVLRNGTAYIKKTGNRMVAELDIPRTKFLFWNINPYALHMKTATVDDVFCVTRTDDYHGVGKEKHGDYFWTNDTLHYTGVETGKQPEDTTYYYPNRQGLLVPDMLWLGDSTAPGMKEVVADGLPLSVLVQDMGGSITVDIPPSPLRDHVKRVVAMKNGPIYVTVPVGPIDVTAEVFRRKG